jgi:hypothetical protein
MTSHFAPTLLKSNHVHLPLQALMVDALERPLRWFLTETVRAFHQARGRRGHLLERRYRSCLIEEDPPAFVALRYLDWNPVRAGTDDPELEPLPRRIKRLGALRGVRYPFFE